MASKEELKGGLSALFGGGTPQPTQEQTAEDFTLELTSAQDEDDLINSIDDAELRARLHAKRVDRRGRPRKNTDERGKRVDGYSRTSLILRDDKVAKIKEIAFRETLTMKEIFELALDMVIKSYEDKHGEVIPQPERYKGDIKKVFK